MPYFFISLFEGIIALLESVAVCPITSEGLARVWYQFLGEHENRSCFYETVVSAAAEARPFTPSHVQSLTNMAYQGFYEKFFPDVPSGDSLGFTSYKGKRLIFSPFSSQLFVAKAKMDEIWRTHSQACKLLSGQKKVHGFKSYKGKCPICAA
jgi:hypothetical protein